MAAAGVSKLGTSLSVVFVAFLVALFAQFILVLCRRRRRRRTVPPVSGDDERRSPLASKEVFLFFCLRTAAHPSRVEPSSTPSLDDSAGPTPESPEMDLVDLLKLSGGGLYGPSKILFTIKEEEKEEMESVCSNSAEKGPEWKYDGGRRSLEDCFQIEEGTPEIKPAAVCSTADYCCVNIETTPFATPCASPSYFTPSESPGRGQPINMPPPPPQPDV